MTVGWLKRNMERNHVWREVFGLRQGAKWTDTIIEIVHTKLDQSIWVVAFGLTGKHRGINIDDYRPDLIMIDDIIDEEVAASAEQRQKAEDLVLGSLLDSLVPRSENLQAKMVMTHTPMNHEDPAMKALNSTMWTSMLQGCWTKASENKPIDYQESVWPERYPTLDLRERKRDAIANNKASLFAREKECKLVTPETSDFRREWLQYYNGIDDIPGGLAGMWIALSIDPVPPPSQREIDKNLQGKDYEVLSVVGFKNLDYYLLEYSMNRGHDPSWTIAEFFRLVFRWNPRKACVEEIAYQKTLSWLLSKAMNTYRRYVPIEGLRDKRAKRDRIVDALAGPASHGHLFVLPTHTDFISQFTDYPNVQHDDVIDCVSMGVSGLSPIELSGQSWDSGFEEMEDLPLIRGAP
jgi:phage terminase large subunit-like protein